MKARVRKGTQVRCQTATLLAVQINEDSTGVLVMLSALFQSVEPAHKIGPHAVLIDRRNPLHGFPGFWKREREISGIQAGAWIDFGGREAEQVSDNHSVPDDPVVRAYHAGHQVGVVRDPILKE